MEATTKTSGLTYSTISGIQKIKLAGAEKRMFARWAKSYAKEAELEYNPPMFLKLSTSFSLAISLIGTLVLYSLAIKSNISVADYYAFNTAYAMVQSAFSAFVSITVTLANIKPTLEMAMPIVNEVITKNIDKKKIAEDSFVLFVNDGSKDRTWELIEEEHNLYPVSVKGVKLAGNVGHQYALTAGLLTAMQMSDVTVSIDADLQDDTGVFEEMMTTFTMQVAAKKQVVRLCILYVFSSSFYAFFSMFISSSV